MNHGTEKSVERPSLHHLRVQFHAVVKKKWVALEALPDFAVARPL